MAPVKMTTSQNDRSLKIRRACLPTGDPARMARDPLPWDPSDTREFATPPLVPSACPHTRLPLTSTLISHFFWIHTLSSHPDFRFCDANPPILISDPVTRHPQRHFPGFTHYPPILISDPVNCRIQSRIHAYELSAAAFHSVSWGNACQSSFEAAEIQAVRKRTLSAGVRRISHRGLLAKQGQTARSRT